VEILGFAIYLAVKAIAYVGWCFAGVRLLDPGRAAPFRRAVGLGLARLGLGIVLGLFIFLAALSMNNATRNAPLTYVAIYVPVRIVEWMILRVFMTRNPLGVARETLWAKSAFWVGGGVVISCLADLPLGVMEGGIVPVGRPFC
jgi:hypothetical protein